jgi:hypothetical protein
MTTTLQILSLGAGVQSTAIALMACDGKLPGLNAAIFADTGWEPTAVYDQVNRLETELNAVGIPLYRVSNGNLRQDSIDTAHRFAAIPYFVKNGDGTNGIGRRQCTSEYKLKPINRKCRELLGANPPDYRSVRKGNIAHQWIGFSTDEIHRVNNKHDVLYLKKRYPLIELDMSRKDCERWLARKGWGHTVKSACIGCPFHGNRTWRDMRDNRPDEWEDAIAFDNAIRDGGSRPLKNGQAFLHASRVPLAQAPIDRVSRSELKERQTDIFDLIEDGDPDGCSPYGCRSGEPV